ncbi:MAG: RNA polymerase factor sigma-54 [Candidatus Competibacterales bacterium]|nr:RNA polymerase factor sigma-54 [Candidatus Competibacterales bacterium]
MRQSLQLRLGQQLTMTPQLQQAIRLLQLSSLELQTEIQTALESNFMLERAEDGASADSGEANSESGPATDSPASDETLPEELPVDSNWEDVYDSYDGTTSFSRNDDATEFAFDQHLSSQESLQDYLNWQLRLTPFSERDRIVAEALIEAVDEGGYLSLALEEIQQGLPQDLEIEADEILAVLHLIQHFDPPGIAARDPGECLQLQLEQLPPDTPWLAQARQLVSQHLALLAGRDFNTLMRRLKVSRDELQEIVALVRSLNPHPGTGLSHGRTEYIVPDVFVYKRHQTWRVELNPDNTPRLRINRQYAQLVRRADNSTDNTSMRNHLQEARWFLKSLQNRNETLLKVASCIVEHQRGFLEHGEEFMKPLVLRDIAESVDMHESTISRVTNQKYMHTPRGIFEFKYFFSSHVSTSDGGECSAVAIRAMIKKLIQEENPQKPLSDSKLAQLLKAEGINVARRTIAKYREMMGLPPSSERKQLA